MEEEHDKALEKQMQSSMKIIEKKLHERQAFMMSLTYSELKKFLKNSIMWTLTTALELAKETECYEIMGALEKELQRRKKTKKSN